MICGYIIIIKKLILAKSKVQYKKTIIFHSHDLIYLIYYIMHKSSEFVTSPLQDFHYNITSNIVELLKTTECFNQI